MTTVEILKEMAFTATETQRRALEEAISALSTEGDLISRQAVLDELEKWDWQDLYLPIHFKQILDDVPSVENKGEWIYLDECANSGYYCSICHKKLVKDGWSDTVKKINFCPNCGARMKGGET